MRVCSFGYCDDVCKSGLSFTKGKFEWDTSTRHKRILFGFFSLNSFSFYCTINGTNVQIERTWKDTESVLVVELKTSLAHSLRTTCLREFRYQVDESSSINQIPHVSGYFLWRIKINYKRFLGRLSTNLMIILLIQIHFETNIFCQPKWL